MQLDIYQSSRTLAIHLKLLKGKISINHCSPHINLVSYIGRLHTLLLLYRLSQVHINRLKFIQIASMIANIYTYIH